MEAIALDVSRFVQPGVTLSLPDGEHFPEFRPTSSEQALVLALAAALEREVAAPLLAARSNEAFSEALVVCIPKFSEIRATHRGLVALGLARFSSRDETYEQLRLHAEKLGGPEMAKECEVAASTHLQAIELTNRILAVSPPPVHEFRDLAVATSLGVWDEIFECMRYLLLYMATDEPHGDSVEFSAFAVTATLETASKNAYEAAVARLELRRMAAPLGTFRVRQSDKPQRDFKTFLLGMPNVGGDEDFARDRSERGMPREIDL